MKSRESRMLAGICRLIVALVVVVVGLLWLLPTCEVAETALPPSVERLMASADKTLAGQVRRLEARVEVLEVRIETEESWTAYWRGIP